jgi:pimeloyl-ACP methyl ester carboxylesterase
MREGVPPAAHERTPIESRRRVNGVELAVFDWPGEGAPVLFVHATGFHARCWDRTIAGLPGRRCIAVDLRGHGRSEKPPPVGHAYDWYEMSVDLAELARVLDLRGALGVGHSMGAYEVTVAATLVPEAFARLLLVDPTIGPRERYGGARWTMSTHFAARRRNAWASPAEMFERFHDRPPFNTWQPAVLRDYCIFGLLPAPEGEGYVLACPPEVEAAVYVGQIGYNVYEAVDAVAVPVRVLRAKPRDLHATPGSAMGMSGSPAAPDLAAQFRHGEDVFLPEHSHFIPMEAPDLIARHVRELAE